MQQPTTSKTNLRERRRKEPSEYAPAGILAVAVTLLVSLVVALGAFALIVDWTSRNDPLPPALSLPLLLLTGVTLLFGAIAVTVYLYRRLGLQAHGHALGLPDGSVRAIIALILIFLFFVAITFIFSSFVTGGQRPLNGLSVEQFEAIPADDLVASERRVEDDGQVLYDVVLAGSVSDAAEDIGKNLVVLLGTLVTSVVAFYFGANSVSSATTSIGRLLGRGQEPRPEVSNLDPSSGPRGGGTSVILTGSGFTADAAVFFGPNEAQTVDFDTETQIRAVSPPKGEAGTVDEAETVDVVVRTAGGTSAATSSARFTYTTKAQVPGGVPDLRGKRYEEVQQLLAGVNLVLASGVAGPADSTHVVIDQEPASGAPATTGDAVRVEFGPPVSPPPAQVPGGVPDLRGKRYEEVQQLLAGVNLVLASGVAGPADSTHVVMDQEPASGAPATTGDAVRVEFGPPPTAGGATAIEHESR